jgi:hypothetical protein
MASQVRPGLAKPDVDTGLQESVNVIGRQPAHSIRARDLESQSQAGCMAAINSWDPEQKKNAWQQGASMYVHRMTSFGKRKSTPSAWKIDRCEPLNLAAIAAQMCSQT